jgi:hypothetical protein
MIEQDLIQNSFRLRALSPHPGATESAARPRGRCPGGGHRHRRPGRLHQGGPRRQDRPGGPRRAGPAGAVARGPAGAHAHPVRPEPRPPRASDRRAQEPWRADPDQAARPTATPTWPGASTPSRPRDERASPPRRLGSQPLAGLPRLGTPEPGHPGRRQPLCRRGQRGPPVGRAVLEQRHRCC